MDSNYEHECDYDSTFYEDCLEVVKQMKLMGKTEEEVQNSWKQMYLEKWENTKKWLMHWKEEGTLNSVCESISYIQHLVQEELVPYKQLGHSKERFENIKIIFATLQNLGVELKSMFLEVFENLQEGSNFDQDTNPKDNQYVILFPTLNSIKYSIIIFGDSCTHSKDFKDTCWLYGNIPYILMVLGLIRTFIVLMIWARDKATTLDAEPQRNAIGIG